MAVAFRPCRKSSGKSLVRRPGPGSNDHWIPERAEGKLWHRILTFCPATRFYQSDPLGGQRTPTISGRIPTQAPALTSACRPRRASNSRFQDPLSMAPPLDQRYFNPGVASSCAAGFSSPVAPTLRGGLRQYRKTRKRVRSITRRTATALAGWYESFFLTWYVCSVSIKREL